MAETLNLFVSASEASADHHAAEVVAEILKLLNQSNKKLNVFGLGGLSLQEKGQNQWMQSIQFSVAGGPAELLSKIPLRNQLEKKLEDLLIANAKEKKTGNSKIDGALLIDGGEINLRFAALLKYFKIPVIYYIPPKVWVWRMGRLDHLKNLTDLVCGILPFEEKIYAEWEIPFEYVGNPIVDEIQINNQTTEEKNSITVMPGSRHSEIKYHLPIFSEALNLFFKKIKNEKLVIPKVLIPIAQGLDFESLSLQFQKNCPDIVFEFYKGQSHECLKKSRAALVKSGTSTLEAAYIGVPMVLAYKSSKSTELIFKTIVGYKGFVGLVNLFLEEDSISALGYGDKVPEPTIPELVLNKCEPQLIAEELFAIYIESKKREKQLSAFENLKKKLRCPVSEIDSPSKLVALRCLEKFVIK